MAVCLLPRSAKSGKLRKCLLRTFLDCADICQHRHNKTKMIYAFSADFRIFWEIDFVEKLECKLKQNNGNLYMISVEFISLWKLLDCAKVFPHKGCGP